MPSNKNSSPLLLLSGSGNVLAYLILLLTLAATMVLGQEAGLTPARISYDRSPVRTSPAIGHDAAANPLYLVSAPCLQYEVATAKLDHLNIGAWALDASLDPLNGSYRHNWLQLVRRKSDGDGGTGFWGHLEAGYGQFCRLESGFGRTLVEWEWEQPSCAYLKARFSF